MEKRPFGSTGLDVSQVGFGAWAIGGPASVGGLSIGWGEADDAVSVAALRRAADEGITLVDTADFYGFGHSEVLVGQAFGNRPDIVVATKVGQRLGPDGGVLHDYSPEHIVASCEASLRRLRRDRIDVYQLHTAKVAHLEAGGAIEAMQRLKEAGKVGCWGVSLATFRPHAEAEWLLSHGVGQVVQLVLSVVNQRAVDLLPRLRAAGYGVIARMPFQFGLLTGRLGRDTAFGASDHRSFRLPPEVLARALPVLEDVVWPMADRLGVSPAALALSFPLSFPEVSTVIPGIRTPEQASSNARLPVRLDEADHAALRHLFSEGPLRALLADLEARG